MHMYTHTHTHTHTPKNRITRKKGTAKAIIITYAGKAETAAIVHKLTHIHTPVCTDRHYYHI